MTTYLLVHGAFSRSWVWESTAAALRSAGADRVEAGVVLVGHSGAGMVLAEMGGSPAVHHTVYLAALRPQRGQTVGDMLGQPPGWIVVRPEAGVLTVHDDPEVVRAALAADVDAERFARDVYPRFVPTSLGSIADASAAPDPRHRTTYVVCEQDRAVPVEAQEAMAAAADRVERLASAHLPQLSMPERLARVLADVSTA